MKMCHWLKFDELLDGDKQDMCLKLLKENFTEDEVELIKANLLDDHPDYWPEEAVMRFFEQAMTDESLAAGEESETRFRINYVHAPRMRASEQTLYSKEKCRPPHKNRLIKGLIAYAGKRHHILAGNTFTATPFNMHPKKRLLLHNIDNTQHSFP